MKVGNLVLPYAAGTVCSCWSQKVEQACTGGTVALGATLRPLLVTWPSGRGWTAGGRCLLLDRRSLSPVSRPVTPETTPAIDCGTETVRAGARSWLPFQRYVRSVVSNAF